MPTISPYLFSVFHLTSLTVAKFPSTPSTHFNLYFFTSYFPEKIDYRRELPDPPRHQHVYRPPSCGLCTVSSLLCSWEASLLLPKAALQLHVLLMYSGVCSFNSSLSLLNHQMFPIIPISIEYVIISLHKWQPHKNCEIKKVFWVSSMGNRAFFKYSLPSYLVLRIYVPFVSLSCFITLSCR